MKQLGIGILLFLFSLSLFGDESKAEATKNVKEGFNRSLDKRKAKNKKKRYKKKPCNTIENCQLKYCKNTNFCIAQKPCNTEYNCRYKHCKNTNYCIERRPKEIKLPKPKKTQHTKINNTHKKPVQKKSTTRKIVEKGVDFAMMGVDRYAPALFALNATYLFQHWAPDHIENTTIDTNTLSYFRFSLNTFKDWLSIDYETNFGGSSLFKQKELLELRSKSKQSWEKLIANLELPITFYAGEMKFRIYFAYSSELFLSTLRLKSDREYGSDAKSGTKLLPKGSRISTQTKFQDFYFGMKTNSPLSRFGLFHTRYNKPYSFNTGEEQVDRYIFDSLFTAWGIYLDLYHVFKGFHFGAKFKLGLGETELAGIDLSITDVLAERGNDYTLNYIETVLTFGYSYTTFYDVLRLYIMSQLRYRKFFLKENVDDDLVDENGDPIKGEIIHFNGDLILNVSAGFSINF